jgi:hypothetical protein
MNALTYLNQMNDGFGAQYQRIVGIFALTRRFGLNYHHSPPEKIEHGVAVEDSERFLNLAAASVGGHEHCVDLARFDPARITGDRTLYRVCLPYDVLDKQPEIYEEAAEELRRLYHRAPKPELTFVPGKVNVAVNVRRGDVIRMPERFLPNDVYRRAMKVVAKRHGRRNCVFHIFSDSSTDLPSFGMTRFCGGWDALVQFHHLVMSDVLIMSRSSFSYLAGIYNPKSVYYHPFWHAPLPRWNVLSYETSGERIRSSIQGKLTGLRSRLARLVRLVR